MQSGRVAVIAELGTRGPRVRLNFCPRCSRQIILDHVGVVEDGAEYVDLTAVAFAQTLHLATCAG